MNVVLGVVMTRFWDVIVSCWLVGYEFLNGVFDSFLVART